MATKSFGFKELALSAPAGTTCTFAISPCRKRLLGAGRTRMMYEVLSPARPQKYQHVGSPAKFPSRRYAAAVGSVCPRSHLEITNAEVFSRSPNSVWEMFSLLRKALTLADHSGSRTGGFLNHIVQPQPG